MTRSAQVRHFHSLGFTLVEFLIVTVLGIMLMLAASSVFLTLLVGRAKTANDQRLKTEGDFAMSQMIFSLRNATKLLPYVTNPAPACSTSNPTADVVLQAVDGTTYRFAALANPSDGGNLELVSIKNGTTAYLTSSSVTVKDGPHFVCNDNASKGNRYLTIDFTLTKNGSNQLFSSGVSLRNY